MKLVTVRSRKPVRRPPGRPSKNVLLAMGWHHDLLQRGVVRFARQAGWHVRFDTARTNWLPRGWRGDGMVTNALTCEELASRDLALDVPTVAMDERFDGHNHKLHGRVLIDADAVGRMAGAYLADRGFRNFAMFIRLRHEAETLAMRGFNALLKSRGFSVRECCWESMRDEYHSRAWTERQKWFGRELGKLCRPAGVFVWDDVFASELIDACTSFGIAVPEDVAVLGAYNDAEICDLAPIPFSSIDVNLELLGYRAAEMLDGIMRGERPPRKALLIPPKSVVTRVSTDILAIDDACVAKAMRFFQERYADPMLTVDHVVEHMHLSKRSLYVAFQKRMGRAPHQELMRLRIEKSKELLLNTPLQMKEIWGASGFSSLHHMYQVFKRDVGMPPQQYRAQHSPGESR